MFRDVCPGSLIKRQEPNENSINHAPHFISVAGKGVSIWDTYVHYTPWIIDSSTGDVTADSYHRYKQDVEALAQMGVRISYMYLSPSRGIAELDFILWKPKFNYAFTTPATFLYPDRLYFNIILPSTRRNL
jgi:hypothetical protein